MLKMIELERKFMVISSLWGLYSFSWLLPPGTPKNSHGENPSNEYSIVILSQERDE